MASCERLKEKGKHNMAIIGAAMRKLLNIIFDIFKFKKKAFDQDPIKKYMARRSLKVKIKK